MAVKLLNDVSIERQGDELCLFVLAEEHRRGSASVMSPEVLEIHLSDRISSVPSVRGVLEAFVTSLPPRYPLPAVIHLSGWR